MADSRWTWPDVSGHPRYKPVHQVRHGTVAEDMLVGGYVGLKFLKRYEVGVDTLADTAVQSLLKLRHPHIVPLKEVFIFGEYLVLVFDCSTGEFLSDMMSPGKGLPEGEARWLFCQVLFALDYCHRMGLPARSISWDNIWVLNNNPECLVAQIFDFGLSQRPDTASSAPESAFEHYSYDPKAADIWSCGMLLLTMLAGEVPQGSGDKVEITIPSNISEGCRSLIQRMLAKDPRVRPSSRAILEDPWMSMEGVQASALLDANKEYVKSSLSNPLPEEVTSAVHSILVEAFMCPPAPGKKK